MIGTPVEGQSLMVVAFTQGIAPVPVLGADGRAHGIGLGLADQPYAVGLDEVLQQTSSPNFSMGSNETSPIVAASRNTIFISDIQLRTSKVKKKRKNPKILPPL